MLDFYSQPFVTQRDREHLGHGNGPMPSAVASEGHGILLVQVLPCLLEKRQSVGIVSHVCLDVSVEPGEITEGRS